MHRVRIGLTGLAFVFLVVLLAMVITRQPLGEAPITANSLERQRSGQPAPIVAEPEPESDEPLAELGVAPGKAETEESATVPPPAAPVPAPTQAPPVPAN